MEYIEARKGRISWQNYLASGLSTLTLIGLVLFLKVPVGYLITAVIAGGVVFIFIRLQRKQAARRHLHN